jgi:hypothetical protein
MFKEWDELTELEQLQSIYSDAYKDAYGFRPRGMSGECWNSVEWLKEELKFLDGEIARRISEAEEDGKVAVEIFEKTVTAMIEAGANDRETALRWIFDAEDLDINDKFDRESLCYQRGLPYHYFRKAA